MYGTLSRWDCQEDGRTRRSCLAVMMHLACRMGEARAAAALLAIAGAGSLSPTVQVLLGTAGIAWPYCLVAFRLLKAQLLCPPSTNCGILASLTRLI